MNKQRIEKKLQPVEPVDQREQSRGEGKERRRIHQKHARDERGTEPGQKQRLGRTVAQDRGGETEHQKEEEAMAQVG